MNQHFTFAVKISWLWPGFFRFGLTNPDSLAFWCPFTEIRVLRTSTIASHSSRLLLQISAIYAGIHFTWRSLQHSSPEIPFYALPFIIPRRRNGNAKCKSHSRNPFLSDFAPLEYPKMKTFVETFKLFGGVVVVDTQREKRVRKREWRWLLSFGVVRANQGTTLFSSRAPNGGSWFICDGKCRRFVRWVKRICSCKQTALKCALDVYT